MGLITSAAQAQAVRQQGEGADGRVSSRDNAFRNVLKNGISGAVQDMDAIFEEAAARYSLPSKLIRAVAKAESDFNPRAVSHAGAIGGDAVNAWEQPGAWGYRTPMTPGRTSWAGPGI